MFRGGPPLGTAPSWGTRVGSLIKSSEQPRGKRDHPISQMRKTKHRAAQTWQARQPYTGSKTGSQQQRALSHLEARGRTPFLVFRTGPWIFPESAPRAGPRPAVSSILLPRSILLVACFPNPRCSSRDRSRVCRALFLFKLPFHNILCLTDV